ncbi:hypothetical protein CSC74_08895 [Pseudoxanthomonas yeongjuensis]|uniref:DUF3471 domain-containing protein n=1 Tax=Pseudoxanthomonas yeongjuensis TaxID=377616 RepID=UPI00139201F6|nr:DUF3471 domain-containing protein [Pseudoxanthomonas yeongjuensis]KAF1716972.1 hypothetical protein CSC74_08895 [Pseudoxanthomonas yeongjuensis]
MNRFRLLPLALALALAVLLPCAASQAQEKPAAPDSGVFVSEGTLDTYVGTYVISPGFELRVWREGEQLMLQATGQAAWPLQGLSETVFRVQAMDAKVTFGTNAAGDVDQLVLLMDGRETKAIRR